MQCKVPARSAFAETLIAKATACRAEAMVSDMVARDRYMSVTEDPKGWSSGRRDVGALIIGIGF